MSPGPQISTPAPSAASVRLSAPRKSSDRALYSDDRLLDQLISSCQAESLESCQREKGWPTASAPEPPHAAAVRVPCLGLLSDRALIGTALSGVDEVHI